MLVVLVTLIPGIGAMSATFGLGVLYNVAVLSLLCILCEATCLWVGGKATGMGKHLGDASALVTAWLLAICLPPYAALSVLSIAALAAIGLAKHAYGGLGKNIFNPAMVGYAVVLVSFPALLSDWPQSASSAAFADSTASIDGLSGATILSDFRYRGGSTAEEFYLAAGVKLEQQEIISAAFALGGVVLIYFKLIAWRIPVGMVLGVGIAALFGADQGSSQSLGSIWFHLTCGGFAAAAFFVATDPVTHPHSHRYQLLFGALIGLIAYLIRGLGSYPDGLAFAILLANCTTPLLNRLHASAPAQPGGVPHG